MAVTIDVRLRGPSFVPSYVEESPAGTVLRIPVKEAPSPGPVRLSVTFDGYPQRFVVEGTAVSSITRLSVTTLEVKVAAGDARLRELLEFVRSAPRAPRCAPRFHSGELVEVQFERASRSARLHDVSSSGCFLQIPGPMLPEIGARVVVRPGQGEPVDGQVVRSVSADPRGVGVRFTPKAEPTRAQVRRWVVSAMGAREQAG